MQDQTGQYTISQTWKTDQAVQLSKPKIRQNFDSHEHQIALQIIGKIIQRNYSRHFLKRLTFAYIESLKKPKYVQNYVVQQNSNINWPFRELYEKKYRSQQQNELLQFVNLCAEILQSRFKGYLTRKRHIAAITRAKKTNDLIVSFVRRWKVYRTYNCQKIWQIRRKIKQIQKQIDEQEQKFNNMDAKKLKGLYKYLQIYTNMFKQTFQLLMNTGLWTLEKNMKPFKLPNPKVETNIVANTNRRNRQFRPQTKKESKVEQKNNISMNFDTKKQNVDHNIEKQSTYKNNNSTAAFSDFEDRPIKAAGQYKLNQKQIQQNVSVVIKKKQEQKRQDDQVESAKLKERNKKAKQLQKRTKYDPRKAIEEEKKKKQSNEQKKPEDTNEQSKREGNLNHSVDQEKTKKEIKVGKKKQKSEKHIQAQEKVQQSKLVIKIQKQKKVVDSKTKTTQKIEVQNSVSKQIKTKKVASRVDCWANKKQPEPDWVKQYKSRILQNRQSSEQKVTDNLRKSIEKQILVKKVEQKNKSFVKIEQIEKQKANLYEIQRKRLKSQSEQNERQAAIQSWKIKQKQIEELKQRQDEFAGHRKNSTHNLQEQVRAIMQKKNNLRKKQVHRSIQQLQQTYNKHYGDRFQNLSPKLSLLTVARSQQKRNKIVVITDDSQQFNDWFYSLYNSTQYWKLISQQDRIFKSFLTS